MEEVEAVGAFYDSVVKFLIEHDINYPRWTLGVYPSATTATEAADKGEQYMCTNDGVICGAFILNDDPGCSYEKGNWKNNLARGEYMVMHSLAVGPGYFGLGIGTAMVEYSIKTAEKLGYKAVRTDTIPDNYPAMNMYRKAGFTFAGTKDLERGIEGLKEFSLFEYNL